MNYIILNQQTFQLPKANAMSTILLFIFIFIDLWFELNKCQTVLRIVTGADFILSYFLSIAKC